MSIDTPEPGGEVSNPDGGFAGDPPGVGQPVPWQRPGTWRQPAPWQRPSTWQQPGSWQRPGTWRQPDQGPSPAIPGWQAHGTWQQNASRRWPGASPGGYPGKWLPTPGAWALGSVPWGYTNPPAVPPVLEPPDSFHPPSPTTGRFALRGRASARLYGLGLVLGVPGLAALLLYLIGVSAGFKLRTGALPAWLVLETGAIVAAIGLIAWSVAQARRRRADGWLDYNGPSPLLVVSALLAVTTALELPLAIELKAQNVDTESAFATLLLTLVYLATYLGLVHFLAVRVGALTWHDIARPQRLAPSPDDWGSSEPRLGWPGQSGETANSWRARVRGGRVGDILIPLAFVVPLMLVSNLLSVAMLLVLGLRSSDISAGTPIPTDGLSMALLLVAVAIVAPIGEEVFFRGFATNAWGRSISRNSTILRASLFFAFIHVLNTVGASTDAGVSLRVAIFNFGARVPIAFALTWLYMRRRSILASGTLHAAYNGLITVISFL